MPLTSVATSVKWAFWIMIVLSRGDNRVTKVKHVKCPTEPPVPTWASANNPSLSLMCASLESEGTVAFHRLYPSACQAGAGAGFLPAQPGRGHHPAWVLHAPAAWVCMQPACRGGLGAKGNLIVFPPHMLYSLQPTAFRTRCLLASPLVAELQPHTRPGTPPVTLLSLPTQGLWRAEIMGSTQNWPLLILFHRILECPRWRGPGSSASPIPWLHRQETGPQGL